MSPPKKTLQKEVVKKIMVPRIFFKVLRGKQIISYPDEKGIYLTTEKLVNLIIDKKKYNVSYYFLSGIFNSKIPSYYIQKILFSDTTETSRVLDAIYLNEIILPAIDSQNKQHKKLHDKIEISVVKIIELNEQLKISKLISEKESIKREIKYNESTIDSAVYQLYNLAPEEIKIIEEDCRKNNNSI